MLTKYCIYVLDDETGLAAPEGPLQVEHRRFALKTLRELRNTMNLDELLADECRCLVECYLSQSGREWAPHEATDSSVSNVVCRLVFGRRFDHDDEQFHSLIRSQRRAIAIIGQARALPSLPALRFLPPWRGQFAAVQSFLTVRVDICRQCC